MTFASIITDTCRCGAPLPCGCGIETVRVTDTVSLADGAVVNEGTLLEVLRRYQTRGIDGPGEHLALGVGGRVVLPCCPGELVEGLA